MYLFITYLRTNCSTFAETDAPPLVTPRSLFPNSLRISAATYNMINFVNDRENDNKINK